MKLYLLKVLYENQKKERKNPLRNVQKPTKKHSKPTKFNLLSADKAYF